MSGTSDRADGGAVLWLCFLAAMIEGFDIQVAGVVAPRLAGALSLTPAQMGLFFSSATFGLILGALVGGRIADRFGRRTGLVLALAFFGIFSIATAFVSTFEGLFAMRLLTGVGLGGALPNLIAIAAEASHPERRGFAVGMMYAGLPFGGAVASAVSIFGLNNDWQTIFLVGGAMPLLIVPILLWRLPDFKIGAKITQEQTTLSTALHHIFGRGNLTATILLWVSFFFSLLILYLLLNWLPALLVSKGFGRQEASIIQVAFNVAGAGGSLIAGRALDTRHRTLLVLATFASLILALFALAVLQNSLLLAILASAFVGAAVIAAQAILYGLAPQCYPAEARGTGVGFAIAAGRFGSVTGPLLAGALVASGGTSNNVLLGILPIAIIGAVSSLLLVARLRSQPETTKN